MKRATLHNLGGPLIWNFELVIEKFNISHIQTFSVVEKKVKQ